VAVQLPAALVHRMMMATAQQQQVAQVGGAAVEPVAQVMGVAPGHRPVTPWEPAATVAHRQGGALGGGDHAAGTSYVQRLRPGTTKRRWQQAHGGAQLGGQVAGGVRAGKGVEHWAVRGDAALMRQLTA
jgi:hypothetical protein